MITLPEDAKRKIALRTTFLLFENFELMHNWEMDDLHNTDS